MTGSKFSGLRAMREKRTQEAEAEAPAPSPTAVPAPPPLTPEEPRRRVGRPPGKRSDPNYQQVTVLLRANTYLEVRKRLLDERKEVSELLNDLLDEWLKR
ncbi:hypothetical protein DGo_PB0372 (plasmid) [Deinococcus gobiensis I-0]|uniref:Uncharacterized protein n=1 Tax=Deinococcus gobiensis (strain DSM 21396 / JCM 16679 / CGMCC 1.7299 / I-0) TaxID=745776 RepID=H8H294_DEIGI|nr:hypothetical protein DGo_PB0372 [Deinococcus gobiensis I-0]